MAVFHTQLAEVPQQVGYMMKALLLLFFLGKLIQRFWLQILLFSYKLKHVQPHTAITFVQSKMTTYASAGKESAFITSAIRVF